MSDPGDEMPTGCADDCCHPSHIHDYIVFARRRDDLWRRYAVLKDAKRKWWRALSDPIAWPIPSEPDTHDEWRKLNDG